jgi:hypothetical protein
LLIFNLHENEIKLNESLNRQVELENDFKRTDMFKYFDAFIIQKEIENKKITKEKMDLEEKLKNILTSNNNNDNSDKDDFRNEQVKF